MLTFCEFDRRVQHFRWSDPKRLCQNANIDERDVSLLSFDSSNVGTSEITFESQAFLRPTKGAFASGPNVRQIVAGHRET